MHKLFYTLGLVLCLQMGNAQQLEIGARIQKTNGMYWENGITANFAFKDFKPDNFLVGFSYVSSRLGTAMGSNALKQDSYIAHGTWLFGKNPKPFKFYGRLNIGYFHAEEVADIFEEIPNTSFLFSPEIGFKYAFANLPLTLNLGSGLYMFLGEDGTSPGTLQPLYYHLDISYKLF